MPSGPDDHAIISGAITACRPSSQIISERKRQCACSVVAVVELDGEFVELGHVVANVVGGPEEQMVPRSETYAIQLALEATTSKQDLIVAVDANYVIKRFNTHATSVPLTFKNADIWGRIQVRRQQHVHVKLGKVKSHLSRDMYVEQFGSDNLLHWFGNQRADSLAAARAVVLARRAHPQHVYIDWVDRGTDAIVTWHGPSLPCPPWTSVDCLGPLVWPWTWSWPRLCTGTAQNGCKKVRGKQKKKH